MKDTSDIYHITFTVYLVEEKTKTNTLENTCWSNTEKKYI